MSTTPDPIRTLKEFGRGHQYNEETRRYLLAKNPERSRIVGWAEIAAEQRRMELEAGL
jgi:hypothetical protein